MRTRHLARPILAILGAALLPAMPHVIHAADAPDRVFVEPAAGAAPLVAFIDAARHTLDGEVYLASSKPVLSALEAAADRHVQVRINLEQHPYGTGSAVPALAYTSLAAHGVQVRWTSDVFTYTHAKYLVADDRSAWIGTMNWTTSAFTNNREFGLVDTDATVVRQAEAVFTADWAHSPYTGAAGALVLSPVNARSTLTSLIGGAHHTLDIYAEEVQDKGIVAALEAAAQRGVHVRVVCASAHDVATLRRAGAQVLIKKTPYIHAKVIVADAGAAFIGSENISATSLDHNRELGLVLHDRAAIAAVESTFTQDFGGTGGTSAPTPISSTHVSSGAFAVRVSVSPNSTRNGVKTTITATTSAGASCTVRVVYASGSASGSKFLATAQTADSSGGVSWTWKPSTHRPGPSTATVTCTLAGKRATGTAQFVVQ